MSLRTRLTWLLASVAGFAAIATFGTIYALRLHVEGAILSVQRAMDEVTWVGRLQLEAREQRLQLREIVGGLREPDEDYRTQRDGFFDALRQAAHFTLRANQGLQADLLEAADRAQYEFDRCLVLAQGGGRDEARELLDGTIEGALLPALDSCLRDARAALDASRNQSVDELVASNTQVLILSLIIAAMGVGLVMAGTALVHRWIIVPIRRLQEATSEFTRGNLGYRLEARLHGELGALGEAMNQMAAGLAEAQTSLQVSEAKHRSLFRNLRDATIICDSGARIVECHDGDTGLLGDASQVRKGRPVSELWPERDEQALDWSALVERVLARGTQVRMADLQLLPEHEGTDTVVDLIAYPVEFGHGRHVAIVLRDVTTRRQAEKALRESERRYRMLFERNLAGVYRTTLDGKMLDCNDSMATMLGYESREELLSRPAADLYFNDIDRQSFLGRLREARVLTNSELRLRRKDGSAIHILENVGLLPDEDGARTIIQGTMVDITDRMQAERALRESESILREAQRLAHVGNWSHDVRTGARAWSDEVFRIAGVERQEVTEELVSRLTHPADHVRLREAFMRSEAGRSNVDIEYRVVRPDGGIREVHDRWVSTFDEDGRPLRRFGTIQDITERKQAEEAVRKSERRYRAIADDLRRLTQRLQTVREDERTRIARELHDELGQVLTALNMDLHWLKGRSWHDSEPTQARIASMCELADSTIQSVRRICSDLRPAILDDLGLVAAIEWQAREFGARTGIRCYLSLPQTPVELLSEQSTEVFRIFQESLTNIARHAHACEARVELRVASGVLLLRVTDDGVGITEKQSTETRSLGLAGIRERALRWGGRVEISGASGRGTAVALHMPIQTRAADPSA